MLMLGRCAVVSQVEHRVSPLCRNPPREAELVLILRGGCMVYYLNNGCEDTWGILLKCNQI